MSALTQGEWDYIAHIQREDGTTIEIAGTTLAYTEANAYQDLLQKAAAHDGFLISSSIEAHVPEDGTNAARKMPVLIEHSAVVDETVASVSGFEDTRVFGTFTNTYKGASLCTYKETG